MDDHLSKEEVLALISRAFADAEDAIQSHPVRSRAVYEEAKAAFLEGHDQHTQDSDWSDAHGLSSSELLLIHQYQMAMSFMSAWYQLYGDIPRRDQAAQSSSILVTGIGLDPQEVMGRFLLYEQTWLRMIQSGGMKTGTGCLGTIVFVISAILDLLV